MTCGMNNIHDVCKYTLVKRAIEGIVRNITEICEGMGAGGSGFG